MKAGEFFASKAQQSSESMEKLTIQMHTIAVATKRETVSMHIITVVTLFFLPGTFVAVRFNFLVWVFRVDTLADLLEYRCASMVG